MKIRLSFALLLSFPFFTASAQNYARGSYFQTECDSFQIGRNFSLDCELNLQKVQVFTEKAYLFCSPDQFSKVVDSVSFFTELNSNLRMTYRKTDSMYQTLDDGTVKLSRIRKRDDVHWVRVLHRGHWRFIREKDLATDQFRWKNILVGPDSSGSSLMVKSYRSKNNPDIIDSFRFDYRSHGYDVSFIQQVALPQTGGELLVYRTYRMACPGTETKVFLSFHEGKFQQVASSYGTGEAGTYDVTGVYIPMKFEGGKILLVSEGDLSNIFDRHTGELRVYEYKKSIGIPIEELIVSTHAYTEEVLDEQGNPIMEDHEFKVIEHRDPPKFYRWNGERAVLWKP